MRARLRVHIQRLPQIAQLKDVDVPHPHQEAPNKVCYAFACQDVGSRGDRQELDETGRIHM